MPSPVTTAAPAAPTPQLDVPFPLEAFEVDTRLVPDEDPEGVGAPFIVDREAREVRRWAGAYAITPSPFADVVLATVGGGPSDPGATALLDLSTGVVEGFLPVGSVVLQWPAPDRVFLLIDPLTFGRPPTWLAGIYELDLAARTIELVSRGGGGRMLSPDGTMTLAVPSGPGPRVVVRDLAGGADVYTYDPNRSAAAGRRDVWSARWLEDGRVALSLGGGRVVLADPRSGVEAVYESSTPGLSLFDPSPDGRVIPATSFFGEYGSPDARADTILLDTVTLEVIAGPLANTTPIRWLPDSNGLIMRGGACGPEGDWVEIFDIATGASRRVAPEVDGLFYIDASSDASKVVGGVWESWVVIDVATGAVETLPPLGVRTAAPPYVLDVPMAMQFSGGGRWLVANPELGGEGC